MLQRLITLTVWALLGWMAMALLLRLLAAPLSAPAGAQALAAEPPAPARLTRLFGASAAPVEAAPVLPAADSRFRLIGIVAARQPSLQNAQGVALIAIDGGPPKAFRVGQLVDGALRLLQVERHAVGLGEGGAVQMQLQLQPPPAAATGSLPPPVSMAVPPPSHQVQQPAPSGLPLRTGGPGSQPQAQAVSPSLPMPALPEEAGPRRPQPVSASPSFAPPTQSTPPSRNPLETR